MGENSDDCWIHKDIHTCVHSHLWLMHIQNQQGGRTTAQISKCILLYIYKTTIVQKKSAHIHRFSFFWRDYMQIASHSCSKRPVTWPLAQEEWAGLQSNFHKACTFLQEAQLLQRNWREHKNWDILNGRQQKLTGCCLLPGAAGFGVHTPLPRRLPLLPFHPANTLCAFCYLLFCHDNKSATVVMLFPKKKYTFDKTLAHSRRHELFSFFII